MRKRIIESVRSQSKPKEQMWLNLESLATVEVTSESAEHPIEDALQPGEARGWRATGPGVQTIRLVFDHPQRISRIELTFVGDQNDRTQEYLLRWAPSESGLFHDIVRQQWTFGSPDAVIQKEGHDVELFGVVVLELTIIPDVSGKAVYASMQRMRIA